MEKSKTSDDVRARESEGSIGEWVPRKQLNPWTKNPRKNKHAIAPVADSIKRLGFGAPIVARKSDGRVIAGHTRLLAAESLGLERVPVRWVDVTDREADMLALADNRLGELAQWDELMLLDTLTELGLDDAESVGWDQAALDKMTGQFDERPAKEIDVEGMEFSHKCPACGFGFNDE